MKDDKLALFLMLGQSATKELREVKEIAPPQKVLISETYDLAAVLPEMTKKASHATNGYILFFIFENFLRDFVLDVLSEKKPDDWWSLVPQDVRSDVEELEKKEEQKQWMALTSRSKLDLTTLPQLLRIIDENVNWKAYFEPLIRDKSLVQEARHVSHSRNTICHMADISEEEVQRVKQVMRDWFRVIAP